MTAAIARLTMGHDDGMYFVLLCLKAIVGIEQLFKVL
jgi:hypothetical protein